MTSAWLDRAEYMVHGTPTWSFMYRHLVKGLRDRHRCVVPDHLGFGRSDKPAGDAYRPQDQARRSGLFVEALGLEDVALVVHDFGSPIGPGAVDLGLEGSGLRGRVVVEFPDVGHAPPEERGPESATMVARFLERTVSRRTA